MGGIPENTHIPGEQRATSSSSSQYNKENGSVSPVVNGVRGNEVKKERNYVSEILELFEERRYDYDDLSEQMANINERDFYRLLCVYTNHFVAISKESPNLLSSIYSFHPESFKRLRLSDPDKFNRIMILK